MPEADQGNPQELSALGLRPLSARSVLLSVLLGSDPGGISASQLLATARGYGAGDAAVRSALSRMGAAGDVERDGTLVALADRHRVRQARQARSITPPTRDWDGRWAVTVVTSVGLPAGERQALRAELSVLRMRELRDGVWTRPDNLEQSPSRTLDDRSLTFVGEPSTDSLALTHRLWDLAAWTDRAEALIQARRDHADPAIQLAVGAAMVRHLVADPVLPAGLQPDGWPAARLREAYATFLAETT